MRVLRLLVLFVLAAGLLWIAGCGSRTGLFVPDDSSDVDAIAPVDAGHDASVDAGRDAGVDATPDVLDALPPIDVNTSPPPSGCDGGATLIYVITQESDLMSFDPVTARFTRIGPIRCPALGADTPFSMAVDQTGIAYVVYGNDGQLFRVSTATAGCQPTPYVPGQHGFLTFGMGYSQNPVGAGETLFVASDQTGDGGAPPQLGWIDTNTFQLNVVGPFTPPLESAELTGTGSGGLFAFYSLVQPVGGMPSGPPSAIGQIDKTTGQLIGQSVLPNVGQGCGWAFAFWGGDFYTFTAPASVSCAAVPTTVVTRYRPSDGSIVTVATSDEEIVGAGVSTCAPQK